MNFKESKPIYLQIADRIMDEILQARYGEEGRIPSVREYAAEMEVNANTVMRSYDYLQQQQVIFNRRGIGYLVSAGAVDAIRTSRCRLFMDEELPEFFGKIKLLDIPMQRIAELYENYRNKKS